MRSKFLIFLLLPFLLSAGLNPFDGEEDPTLFHHVNVISGHLNLSIQDTIVQGPNPFPITRTYSSAGALERTKANIDRIMKEVHGGFYIQGGWNLLPHVYMIVEYNEQRSKAYIAERNGSLVAYEYTKKNNDRQVLKPHSYPGPCYGSLSARTNPQNNVLELESKKKKRYAHLTCADGTKRIYKQSNKDFIVQSYRLLHEILPNGHQILYEYDSQHRLVGVKLMNPSGSKTYSWIRLDLIHPKTPYKFDIVTSDNKKITYQARLHEERDYLVNPEEIKKSFEKYI